MKEIGGYIELDRQTGSLFHDHAVALNCGRAAVEYLIRAKGIRRLYIPFFCCDSIAQPCRRCGIEYEYYHIDLQFRPVFDRPLKEGEWLYVVNYYGQLDNDTLKRYQERFRRIIVDNAQAYFQRPIEGVDTIYTCRKFLGVSDGAFLYTDKYIDGLEQDESYERIHYVLGRFERTAEEFYGEASHNNKIFETEPLKKMSGLTDNLLRAIDYEAVRERRTENFRYLHERLADINELRLSIPGGAFMYPLYIKNGAEIRKKLQNEKIYVPTLWPDVYGLCDSSDLEYDMAANILPLPVDQRYGRDEMKHMINELMRFNEG